MPDKSKALQDLAARGVLVPVTHVGTIQRLLPNLDLPPDTPLYCRATIDGHKKTVVTTTTRAARELSAESHPATTWSVQQLYDFDISGALLLTPNAYYIESAWGSSIGLLREGLLAYREYRRCAQTSPTWARYRQEFQLRYNGTRLVPQQVNEELTENSPVITSSRITSLVNALGQAQAYGLFEWGSTPQMAMALDWKLGTHGTAIERLQNLVSQQPEPGLVPDFERPSLSTLTGPEDGRVVFHHGARLSHAITRTIFTKSVEVAFCS